MRISTLVAQITSTLHSASEPGATLGIEDGSSTGASAVWIFANFSYAAMRAQGSESGWRIVCFIFGFPGTLISLLLVEEGSERMYGFDLPKKQR
jgi:hypothetical protein